MTTTNAKSALAILADLVAGKLLPPPPMTVSEWADTHRRVVMKGSPRPGRWDTGFVPHLRSIMNAFSDPLVRRISIMKPTQCGGSEAVINMILYAIDRTPMNMFWVWAIQPNAEDFCKDRLLPEIRACQPAAAHLTGMARDERLRDLKLDNMTIWFRGAPPNGQGARSLESWPAGIVANDELDRCDPDTPEVMEKRTSGFPTRRKMIDLSSPSEAGAGIDALVGRSAGGGLYYWVPCVHCGRNFVPSFDFVKWVGRSRADKATVRRNAWLECPSCGAKIEGHQHKVMMRKGVWAPDWDERRPIEDNPLPTTERIAQCLHADHVGFRIPEFSDPFAINPYGDVAHDFVANGCIATESWTTHKRGRPWSVKGERVKEHELRRLCVPVAAGGYRLGTVPAGCLALSTAIDVQDREAWVVVRGWGRGGSESCLVWPQRVPFAAPGDLSALDAVLNWVFPLAPGWCDHNGEPGAGYMRPCVTCIDSGHNTVAVYDWILRHGGCKPGARNVLAVKGQEGVGVQAPRPFWTNNLTTYPNGQVIPKTMPGAGALLLVNVNSNTWKTWLMERVRGALAEHGVAESADGLGDEDGLSLGGLAGCRWRFPEAAREMGAEAGESSEERLEEYMRQITAEERVEKVLSSGRRVRLWQLRVGGGQQNHYGDCETYAAACMALRSCWGRDLVRPFGLCEQDGSLRGQAAAAKPAGREAGGSDWDSDGERFVRSMGSLRGRVGAAEVT